MFSNIKFSKDDIIIIFGGHASGKTQLANYLYDEYETRGLSPVIKDAVMKVDQDTATFPLIITTSNFPLLFMNSHWLYLTFSMMIDAEMVEFDRALGYYPHAPIDPFAIHAT